MNRYPELQIFTNYIHFHHNFCEILKKVLLLTREMLKKSTKNYKLGTEMKYISSKNNMVPKKQYATFSPFFLFLLIISVS